MTTIRAKPRRADEHLRWLKAIMGKDSYRPEGPGGLPTLAALTGTDYKALEAIDRLWALYCYCDNQQYVLIAIAYAATQMQESTRPLARELIAHALDWGDRDRLWPQVERMISALEGGPPAFVETQP